MRPKIICHMLSSIDGRLLTDRWSAPAAGIDDARLRRYYDEVAERFQADGWMVGRKTMQEFSGGGTRAVNTASTHIPREPFTANRRGRDLAVAIDPHGRLHYREDNAGGDHLVAVLSEQVPDNYLAELRERGVSYLFAGPSGDDLHVAMRTLGEAFGAETLLLEGGGRINGAFLNAGLIDEISVLVYPGIDGLAGMPSIFEFVGSAGAKPAGAQSLRHLATQTLDGGMVWLHYSVERDSTEPSRI